MLVAIAGGAIFLCSSYDLATACGSFCPCTILNLLNDKKLPPIADWHCTELLGISFPMLQYQQL
jgi:hypothetical protein